MKAKRNRSIAMVFAWVLLILVLATSFLVDGTLARFTTGDRVKESARVAKFSIKGSGFSETINLSVTMNPGDMTEEKTFLISNNSEVSVLYTVTIRNTTNNLPLKLLVGTEAIDFSDAAYQYSSTLPPKSGSTASENNFAFKLVWPATPASNRSTVYSGQLDNIAVTVSATQIN